MAYQTFALKYRPRNFDEIVGQDHVATTLRNAVASGRVAHGYLFAGPRGTGKTSTARVLAKALNCERGPTPDPCCECEMCLAIDAGRALDLIEIDAASNRGIDDIRELREGVAYAPTHARVKFYILDEAHMLTPEASNALLKTLEEPPEHVYFVLATTEPHKILPTIHSRCQVFEFRPIPPALMVEALRKIAEREKVEIEEEALGAIARAAEGAMRDAESIFDQAIAFSGGVVTLEAVNAMLGVTDGELLARFADTIADGDIRAVFECVDTVVTAGKDISQLLEDMAAYFRDLLRLSLGVEPPRWTQAATAGRERMQAQATALGPRRLTEIIETLGEALRGLRETAQQSLLLEVTLAHLGDEGAAGTAPQKPAEREQVTPAAPSSERSSERPEESSGGQAEPPGAEAAEEAAETPPPHAEPEPVELPDGELTIEVLREHWPRVCARLEQTGQFSVLAMISDAVPGELKDGAMTLLFPADYPWLRERFAAEYVERLRDALEAVFGVRPEVRCVIEQAEEPLVEVEEKAAPGEATAAAERAAEETAEADAAPAEPKEDTPSARHQERLVEELKLNFDGIEEQ